MTALAPDPAGSPRVSVCLITYNHARHIRQALDSVLMQETSFLFEICLGEDESSDGTREICQDYAARHPSQIRLFLRRRRDVIFIGGEPTGRFNFLETLKACRGDYVALLEGDDYWTSPHKLQRQASFLDEHSELSACGHSVISVDDNGAPHRYSWDPPEGSRVSTAELLHRNCIPTCSSVFRRRLVKRLPRWFRRVPVADWPLHILLSLAGPIAFLDEPMAAYRMHERGRWSRLSNAERIEAELSVLRSIQPLVRGDLKLLAREKIQYKRAFLAWLRESEGVPPDGRLES